MTRKSIVQREKKKDLIESKYRSRRIALKKIIKKSTDFDTIMEAQEKLAKLPLNSSASRCTKRCMQCGRAHAVYRKFGLCRICLRNELMTGNVTGGRKSSW